MRFDVGYRLDCRYGCDLINSVYNKVMTTRDLLPLIRNELVFEAVRSRGPGGQNVNKVSSAALLFWDYKKSQALSFDQKVTITTKLSNMISKEGLVYLRSDEARDLPQNKTRCEEKLIALLTKAFHVDKKRRPSKPTYSSVLKNQTTKNIRSKTKGLRKKLNKKTDWD